MPLTKAQRFEVLATQTNRQYAHAVVYGGLSEQEAAIFNTWVLRNKLGGVPANENLQVWPGTDE